jgi:hypothetical protein
MVTNVEQDDSSRTLARRGGAGDRLAFDALATRRGRSLTIFVQKRMSAPLRRAADSGTASSPATGLRREGCFDRLEESRPEPRAPEAAASRGRMQRG